MTFKRLFSFALLLAWPTVSFADSAGLGAEHSGRSLFERYDALNSGFGDAEVELEMILRSRNGKESHRRLSYRELEVSESGRDGSKSLIVFDAPRDLKGTGLLSVTHRDRADEQWLFLPAFNRVKKVAARNKSGPFMGSEFAFEDMAAFELDRFDYELLGETPCRDGQAQTCWQIERRPVERASGYSRHVVVMDQSAHRIHRIDYFNQSGEHAKTVDIGDFRQLANGMWRGHRMVMRNHLSGRSTELLWHDYRVGVGLDDTRDFSVNALKRSR